jgi:CxxC motif-containing protein (DUF1111 family)
MFTVFPASRKAAPREGVVHKAGRRGPELLNQVDPTFPAVPPPAFEKLAELLNLREDDGVNNVRGPDDEGPSPGAHFSQRNTPALFGVKLIEEIPDRVILAGERAQGNRRAMHPRDFDEPIGRVSRLPDGRIGRFGWKAQTASLSDFVQAACASELGLGNPGQAAARPLYEPGYEAPAIDLTIERCNQLTAFVASLPRPVERVPANSTERNMAALGRRLFQSTGCAKCHAPNLGPVRGIYSDLLLHDMGDALSGGGGGYGDPRPNPAQSTPSDGPTLAEWRTPPLWGVADSAPYLHDGQADTLLEAISAHGGQAQGARDRFQRLSRAERGYVIAFLNTLRAP